MTTQSLNHILFRPEPISSTRAKNIHFQKFFFFLPFAVDFSPHLDIFSDIYILALFHYLLQI